MLSAYIYRDVFAIAIIRARDRNEAILFLDEELTKRGEFPDLDSDKLETLGQTAVDIGGAEIIKLQTIYGII